MTPEEILASHHPAPTKAALLALLCLNGKVECEAERCVSYDREFDLFAKGTHRRGIQFWFEDDEVQPRTYHATCARSITTSRPRNRKPLIAERAGFRLGDWVQIDETNANAPGEVGQVVKFPPRLPGIITVKPVDRNRVATAPHQLTKIETPPEYQE